MEVRSYADLDVWIEARKLVKKVYIISKQFPQEELYGLTSQIRRCAISIPSNIAEGCGRNHTKDTLQFLFIARGSAYELETQLFLSFDLDYISEETCNGILEDLTRCKKLLNGFINYYEKLKLSSSN